MLTLNNAESSQPYSLQYKHWYASK